MCPEVTVDVITMCKEIYFQNLKKCMAYKNKYHSSDIADSYLVDTHLKSLLGTQYLCTGFLWFAAMLYNLLVDRMPLSYGWRN